MSMMSLPFRDFDFLSVLEFSVLAETTTAPDSVGALDLSIAILALVVGIAMLVIGGDTLVKGASALAERLGVTPLIVGLTVVAFGTSAPELAVNLTAAFKGETDVSFGNIIGSNIANIGLIIGVTALIRPLVVHKSIITREIPIMILVSIIVLIMAHEDHFLVGTFDFDKTGAIGRIDGGILLFLFALFMGYTIWVGLKQRNASSSENSDAFLTELEERESNKKPLGIFVSLVLLILGLINVVLGGQSTVNGAVTIADSLSVPPAIVGLTVVAIGTSLPELATGIVAVRKGHTDIAVGNVIGSNLFNLLFILGPTALVQPVAVPVDGGQVDMLMMLGLSLALLPLSITGQRRIVRLEGAMLLALYLGFIGMRATSQGSLF